MWMVSSKSIPLLLALTTTTSTFLTTIVLAAQLRANQNNISFSTSSLMNQQAYSDKTFEAQSANAVHTGALTPDGQNVKRVDGSVIGPLSSYSAAQWGTLTPHAVEADVGKWVKHVALDVLDPSGGSTWFQEKASRKLKTTAAGSPAALRRWVPLTNPRTLIEHMQTVMMHSGCNKPGASAKGQTSECVCMDELISVATKWAKERETNDARAERAKHLE